MKNPSIQKAPEGKEEEIMRIIWLASIVIFFAKAKNTRRHIEKKTSRQMRKYQALDVTQTQIQPN